ncbi:MAG: hypothetical protein IJA69_02835 [Clostridia bacterium]|nr:hypothetical protein [Clostridia bacterium]
MKKKILSFLFAMFLFVPCMAGLTACSGTVSVWGNTFKYQGEISYFADSWSAEEYGHSSVDRFLNDRVSKIDWENSQIDLSQESFNNATGLINILKQKLDTNYRENADLDKFTITFSSEEEKTVTFAAGEETLTLYIKVSNMEGLLDAYQIPEGQEGHEDSKIISFRENCVDGEFYIVFAYKNMLDYESDFDFKFTETYKDYENKDTYDWTMTFRPIFNKI